MKLTRREAAQSVLYGCPPEQRAKLMETMTWLKAGTRPPRAPSAHGKRNEQPEAILQVAVVKLLRSLPATLAFSVPNHLYLGAGSSAGARSGYIARQKAAGLLPGAADLVIIFRNINGVTTVVLPELKSQTGHLSDSQQEFAKSAGNLGCFVGVIRSLEDLIAMLRTSGHPSFK